MGKIYNKTAKTKVKAEHPNEPHRWGKGAFGRKKCAKCGKSQPKSQLMRAHNAKKKAKAKGL